MRDWFYFNLSDKSSVSLALQELSSCHLETMGVIEDPETGECVLCASAEEDLFPTTWQYIKTHQKISSEIDWTQEWISFCPYFKKELGLARIPLREFYSKPYQQACEEELILRPGPGFGDLSHPTTHLSLQFLASSARQSILIDLGCGSGILGLAALKWGAQFVYGLDIEPSALEHAKENAKLNALEQKILFSSSFPQNHPFPPSLVVVNMTLEEQKTAIASLQNNACTPPYWITSGILKTQQKKYLSWMEQRGFLLKSSRTKEQWMGFLFQKKGP